ncbi:PEP-CTERM sorting domain-containing protein [Parvularcula sp. ZS-1/3]|uniref:PEP-CTERM sorting domain-containing protein n=1 Tax=Parvularcula mediterranea TaxID=2732508 RepID=A0A7Y3RN11_9PROT|nr:PEP-CTERM sorting domain-containing protein [Parvularcula mediterranea]NNU16586.1 PEP-CTERM sorting domain-containing protein [Parvularcula mediterranea]
MFKRYLAATAATIALGLGSANAALIEDEVFDGAELGFGQVLNGSDMFQFLLRNLSTDSLDILVEISASGDLDNLENIRVGLGIGDDVEDNDGTFEDATESLTVVPRDMGDPQRGSAFFLFEDFTTEEAFSVYVAGAEEFDGPTPFTVSIFAEGSNPDLNEIPVPGAALLLGTALAGFGIARRRKV